MSPLGGFRARRLVASVVAAAGLIGAVSAALILGGSGTSPEKTTPPDQGPVVWIQSFADDHQPGGRDVLKVVGRAVRLPTDDGVFAVAMPKSDAPQQRGGSYQGWFVSEPTRPDSRGHWSAEIAVDRPIREPLTVVAVQMFGCRPLSACVREGVTARVLAEFGPNAQGAETVSRPVIAPPPLAVGRRSTK